MPIIQTVDKYMFVRQFEAYNRLEGYGVTALEHLFEYLDEFSDEIGEPIELDVIALCCDWHHYDTEEEALEEHDVSSLDELEDSTTIIRCDNGNVWVQAF
jgi:hypothetical protein